MRLNSMGMCLSKGDDEETPEQRDFVNARKCPGFAGIKLLPYLIDFDTGFSPPAGGIEACCLYVPGIVSDQANVLVKAWTVMCCVFRAQVRLTEWLPTTA